MRPISRAMAAALMLLVLAPTAGDAGPTRQRAVVRAYAAPAPLLEPACYVTPSARAILAHATGENLDDRATSSVGGACVRVRASEAFVSIELIDEMGWDVSATVYFRDQSGDYIDGAQYGLCGRGSITMPDAAWSMVVTAEATNLWCVLREQASESGPATTGTIVATFARA